MYLSIYRLVIFFCFSQLWIIVLMLLMSYMMPAMPRVFIYQLCRNLVEENC